MAKKPNFDEALSNPAEAFFSAQEPPADQTQSNTPPARKEATEAPAGAPEGYIVIPAYRMEAKSRRVQLVIQPGLYEIVKDRATARGQKVNDFICKALEEAIKE